MYYYQVGGLGGHTNNWFPPYDIHGLSDFVFSALSAQPQDANEKKKNTIELVLGILSIGSSYLLVSESQMDTILRFAPNTCRRPSFPRHASVYASLSPITFHTSTELQAKLKTYIQKKSKTPGKDTSQANKMFEQHNPARASFEHQRVLWSAIQSPIDINKFGFCELPVWIVSTSFVALTLQAWQFDAFEKRRKDPTVLTLELACVRCIAFEQEDYVDKVAHTIQHVKVQEHASLINGPTTSSRDEPKEVIKKAELSKRLNDFFASIDSKQAFLLVYDAEQTLNALKILGVNVSSYQDGIATLLYGQNKQQRISLPNGSDRRVDHGDERCSDSRSSEDFVSGRQSLPRRRSRSPRHRSSCSERGRSPPFRGNHDYDPQSSVNMAHVNSEGEVEDDEEAEPATPANVYVIDVQALFLTLRRLESRGLKGLHDLASRLGISNSPGGNDCLLLIDAWKCMASGKAIDEQHAERWSSNAFSAPYAETKWKPRPSSGNARAGITPAETSFGEEVDPNDVVVNRVVRPRPLNVAGGLRPPIDSDSDDCSDY